MWRALAIVAAVVLSGCGLPKPVPDGAPQAPVKSYVLWTVTHDDHWFVLHNGHGYFAHHPDCPCMKRRRLVGEQ